MAIPKILDSVLTARDTVNTLTELGKALKPPKPGQKETHSVEALTRRNGYGTMTSAVTAIFRGHNHRGVGNAAPANNEHHGFTFFTRPRLNLSYHNVSQDRTFTPMLSNNPETVPRAVRAILDPLGAIYSGTERSVGTAVGPDGTQSIQTPSHGSPLIDNRQPFIPLLSNTLASLNGWPDPYLDTCTTRAGMYREEHSTVDSPSKIYNSFELSSNFHNIVGDPIGYLINAWTQYMSLVKEGVMTPYPEMIMENEIDYNTRIYRLIMDPSKTYVLKIAACGAAFPISNSVGAGYNFDEGNPYIRDNDQISVSWKCMGAMYYDPLLYREFNRTVALYNVEAFKGAGKGYDTWMNACMTGKRATKDGSWIALSAHERPLFNYIGIPFINEYTTELMWWVSREDYNAVMGGSPGPQLIGQASSALQKGKALAAQNDALAQKILKQ